MADTSPFPARSARPAADRVDAELAELLRELWAPEPLRRDTDGAYEFRYGCAAGWVAVVDTAPVMVRVTAHAAYDVVRTPDLWTELNDIQLATLSAAVAWCDGTVFVSQTLHPAGLNAAPWPRPCGPWAGWPTASVPCWPGCSADSCPTNPTPPPSAGQADSRRGRVASAVLPAPHRGTSDGMTTGVNAHPRFAGHSDEATVVR